MDDKSWDIVTKPKLAGFCGGVAGLFLLLGRSSPGLVFLIDHANLLFHEAGHLFIGLFSDHLEPYGGTIGQLVFPVVVAISFWRKGQPLGFAAACLWFFENWLNVAWYMADARAQALPLVGGGEHDWHAIFGRWHLLAQDILIARMVRVAGWAGMLAACGWILWRYWRDRQESL